MFLILLIHVIEIPLDFQGLICQNSYVTCILCHRLFNDVIYTD